MFIGASLLRETDSSKTFIYIAFLQMFSNAPWDLYYLSLSNWVILILMSLPFLSVISRSLVPVTQLYVSVDASTKDSLKKIDRPLFKDFWPRFLDSLRALGEKVSCPQSRFGFERERERDSNNVKTISTQLQKKRLHLASQSNDNNFRNYDITHLPWLI